MRYCKDCEFFQKERVIVDKCTHPSSLRNINLVTGENTYWSANDARNSTVKSMCRPAGLHFQRKQSRLEKIMNWIGELLS